MKIDIEMIGDPLSTDYEPVILIFNKDEKTIPLYIKGKYICNVENQPGKSANYSYIDKNGKHKVSSLKKRLKNHYFYYIKYL